MTRAGLGWKYKIQFTVHLHVPSHRKKKFSMTEWSDLKIQKSEVGGKSPDVNKNERKKKKQLKLKKI
jgi:hypothetical protein